MNLKNKSEVKHWLLMKMSDEFDSKEDLTVTRPESVLNRVYGQVVTNNQKSNFQKDKLPSNLVNTLQNRSSNVDNTRSLEVKTNMPKKIIPMLSTLVNQPFNSSKWVFEIKWDGIRSIIFYDALKEIICLQSRSGEKITHRYPEIIRALNSNISGKVPSKSLLECDSAILDGEIVILDNKTGKPSFQSHQKRMNLDNEKEIEILSSEIPATYYLFDILYIDGRDIQNLSFLERRDILSKIVRENNRIKISDFIEENGKEVYETSKNMGLEGIIAKNKFSKYIQGVRSSDWLKIKHIRTQDCVVIGYNRGEGNREKYFGSLLLAAKDEKDRFRFIGHTGSGFDFKGLELMYSYMKKIQIEKCPIDYVLYTNRDTTWIKPEIVVEIKFNDWTRDIIMKSPIFLRTREDKLPKDCYIEKQALIYNVTNTKNEGEVADNDLVKNNYKDSINLKSENKSGLSFTNLNKVYWSKTISHPQLTKKDLIEYYYKISKFILPFIKDRPLSLSRYPDGIDGKSFFHKNWDQNKPKFVQSAKILSRSSSEGIVNYIICNNKDTLLWLANLGCIEIHPWYSRIKSVDLYENKNEGLIDSEKSSLNFPDFIVFDLDPYTDFNFYENSNRKEPEYTINGFKTTVDVALDLKELLDDLKIKSYVKTSGKTGLHVFIPIENSYTYTQLRNFARLIGNYMIKRYPNKLTMEWNISKRCGKVFFDYKQNIRGKTLASIFSLRPIESATVSFPVEWKDLSKVYPTDFTILNVPEILNKHSTHAWLCIVENRQNLKNLLNEGLC